MQYAAMKAIIVHDGKFLVIRQQLGDSSYWDLPGGRVDPGEPPMECLHREIREECGLEVGTVIPAGVWWFMRRDGAQVVCTTFICVPRHLGVDTTKNPMLDEQIDEATWVTKEEFLSGDYPVSHESLKELIRSLELPMARRGKLVRDLIPDIIRRNGDVAETRELSPEEYRVALREKLLEEANEVRAASGGAEIVAELADVQEVLDSLIQIERIAPEEIKKTQAAKRDARGGFERGIFLIDSEK